MFLIATTIALWVLVVVLTLYIVKKKCLSLRQTTKQNENVSEVKPVESKYEALQQRKAADGLGKNTTAEHTEIAAVFFF